MPGGVFIAIGIAAIAIAYAVSRAIARAEFRKVIQNRLHERPYGDVPHLPSGLWEIETTRETGGGD